MTEPREARVYVLAGPDLARSFRLRERSTLGRSDECDVVLRDRSISRKHARIVREGERWFVEDLGSTNGLWKAGQRGPRFELADGDEFRLGDLPLRFKLQEKGATQDIEFASLSPSATVTVEQVRALVPREESPGPSDPVAPVEDVEDFEEIEIEEPDEPLPPSSAARATASPAPRVERRSGLLTGDIEQRPLWLRALLVLVLLALCAGLAFAAFLAVQMLRAGTQ